MNKYSDKKIVWFPEKLNSFLTNNLTSPIYVRIKPTNKCSHNCGFCIYRSNFMHQDCKSVDELPQEKMKEIIGDLVDMKVRAITFSGGGESLMYPNIERYMDTILLNNINLSIITNGQFLSGDRARLLESASWVRISMDYYDEESFVTARGGIKSWFETIQNNIKNFSLHKSGDLAVNFIITKENYKHILQVTNWLKDLGVDNVRYSPVYTDNLLEYHMPIMEETSEQIMASKQINGIDVYSSYFFPDSRSIPHRCYFQEIVPVIAANQCVYRCHNSSYTDIGFLGQIKDRSFKSAWFSDDVRQKMRLFRPQFCDKECANNNKNLFIQEIMDIKNDNFV
jgi:MoaA/NifB/PqqE/SkfB family radical SAM enzyme